MHSILEGIINYKGSYTRVVPKPSALVKPEARSASSKCALQGLGFRVWDLGFRV